eukprot:Rmarinus@m.25950
MPKQRRQTKKRTGSTSGGLTKPVKITTDLADIVGGDTMPRTEIIRALWKYIREHSLQNPSNKREIICDKKMKDVFGHESMSMFDMNKFLNQHLAPADEATLKAHAAKVAAAKEKAAKEEAANDNGDNDDDEGDDDDEKDQE